MNGSKAKCEREMRMVTNSQTLKTKHYLLSHVYFLHIEPRLGVGYPLLH